MNPELLEILACPLSDSRPKLRLQGDYLICDECQMAFPIRNGIPYLLPEDAIPLAEVPDSATPLSTPEPEENS